MEDIRPTIEISVRKLVEFVLASGDIDNRIGAVDPLKAMQEGTKAHQSIQRAAGPEYHAEVPFVYFEHYDEYDLKVSGRADGVIDDVNVTIDEIKGVYLDLDLMDAPLPLHLAQAKCYAFFYSEDHDKCDMSVRMTYINLDNYKIKYFHFNFTYEELKAFSVTYYLFISAGRTSFSTGRRLGISQSRHSNFHMNSVQGRRN